LPCHECFEKIATSLPEVFVLEPRVFGDERGFFLESYNQRTMAEVGIREAFVQDNHSCSSRSVLRGLHYQVKHPQGKLVRVVVGKFWMLRSTCVEVQRTLGAGKR
jgi:dTDP-4-dehydrorhamnose 3,5-epimerase